MDNSKIIYEGKCFWNTPWEEIFSFLPRKVEFLLEWDKKEKDYKSRPLKYPKWIWGKKIWRRFGYIPMADAIEECAFLRDD